LDIEKKLIKIVACKRPRCNCPELHMDDDTKEILIVDDFGGSVKMTYEEFTILARGFLTHV
jgi:hypothetical protein